jgi:hypothetical protein
MIKVRPEFVKQHSGIGASRVLRFALIAMVTILLVTPALWNGQALLYPDSMEYFSVGKNAIRQLLRSSGVLAWQPVSTESPGHAAAPVGDNSVDGTARSPGAPSGETGANTAPSSTVTGSRSVYYGLLAYAGHGSGLWLTIGIPALAIAWIMQLLWIHLWRRPWWGLPALSIGLVAFSPLGVNTSGVLPDVFAPLAIATAAILAAYWPRLTVWRRGVLVGVFQFALMTHPSHIALAALLWPLLAWMAYRRRWSYRRPLLGGLALCLLLAWAGDWGFQKAVTALTGRAVVRLPHLTAHLIDMGPGTRYLQTHCPQASFAACIYVQNYPTYWEDFLFSQDASKGAFGLADPSVQQRMSEEQAMLAWRTALYEPGALLVGLAGDVLRQVATFRVTDWSVSPIWETRFRDGLPPDLAKVFARTRSSQFTRTQSRYAAYLNEWFTWVAYATTLAALGFMARRRWELSRSATVSAPAAEDPNWTFAGLLLAGVLFNAIVCGILASPFGRFQARVIWLVPLAALAIAHRMPSHSAGPGPVSRTSATSSSPRS